MVEQMTVSPSFTAKLSKIGNVSIDVQIKVYLALKVNIEETMELVPDAARERK